MFIPNCHGLMDFNFKLLILRAVFRSCLLLNCSLLAAACSVCIVLLRLAGVVCINHDSCLLDLVDGIVLLDDVVVVLVCDRVLRAVALSLTVGLACACLLLRTLFLIIILLLIGRSSCSKLDVLSTLGTAAEDTLGSSGVSLNMFLVIHLSSYPHGCIVCTLGSGWVCQSCCSVLLCGDGFADV